MKRCTRNPNTCEVAFCGWPHNCEEETKELGNSSEPIEAVDNPLTNTCRIFTTGSCNLEDQLDEAKRKIFKLESHKLMLEKILLELKAAAMCTTSWDNLIKEIEQTLQNV